MDILDEIRAEERSSGSTCRAGAFIDTLDDTQRDAISRAVSEGIQHAAIGRWMVKAGFRYAPASVTRHLAGRCQCQTH